MSVLRGFKEGSGDLKVLDVVKWVKSKCLHCPRVADSLTRKLKLKYYKAATTENAVQLVMEWRADFCLINGFTLVTDRGSHFTSMLMHDMAERMKRVQTFAVPYALWKNGGIEITSSRLMKYLQAMSSELRLAEFRWPELLPAIAYLMNSRRTRRNGNWSANELFFGRRMEQEQLIQMPMLVSREGSRKTQFSTKDYQ